MYIRALDLLIGEAPTQVWSIIAMETIGPELSDLLIFI